MKWLTLELIKAHCRIDSNIENALLTTYGNAAEQGLLLVMRRTWENVRENFSEDDIQGPLTVAALLLVEHLYLNRGPKENVQGYQIPYTVDYYIKPFMRLASDNNEQTTTQGYGCKNL